MDINYNQFISKIGDERFIQPLSMYHCFIDYVSVLPTPEIQQILPNFISSAVIKAIEVVKDCPKSSLSMEIGDTSIEKGFTSDKELNFIRITNSSPVYDFQLTIGNKGIELAKANTSLSDLISTIPIFNKLFEILFNPTQENSGEVVPPSLIDVLGINGRIIRIGHAFQNKLSVINHIASKNKMASTVELTKKLTLTSLSPLPGISFQEQNCPIGALGPEELKRNDTTLCFTKTFDSKKREVWLIIKHPTNIKQQDLDLRFDYRIDEDTESIENENLFDFKTPFIDFYRDLILNRFMPNYMYDINFETRLS